MLEAHVQNGQSQFAIFDSEYYNPQSEIRKGRMLSKNSIYILLIAVSALLTLYFWGVSAKFFFSNRALNSQVPARVIQWEVEEIGSDRYAVAAHYTFEIAEKVYRGNTLFAQTSYPNPASAIASLKEKAAKSDWTAWYCPTDPTRSTLEKFFPQGLLFRAIVSSAVLFYFVLFRFKDRLILRNASE